MITWFFNLTTPYKLVVLLIIFLAGFGAGVQVKTWIYQGEKIDEYERKLKSQDETITRLEGEVNVQSDIARQVAIDRSMKIEEISNLKKELEGTYDKIPANTNACINPVRLRIANKQRQAANSISPR